MPRPPGSAGTRFLSQVPKATFIIHQTILREPECKARIAAAIADAIESVMLHACCTTGASQEAAMHTRAIIASLALMKDRLA